MTKKFWADWQKRISETKQVCYEKDSSCGHYRWNEYLLSKLNGDKIIKADFHNDAVDLIIERHNEVFGRNGNHIHIENEYLTLHRLDIKYVEFIKYL